MRSRGRYHRTAFFVLARTAWITLCAAVLVASGFAWATVSTISTGVERSDAIADDAPRSASGRNILIMGLTTRLDLHGEPLPDDVLRRMQAGESDRGGYNANTLILLHIPTSGPAIAMSVPRDNLVPLTSGGEGKIKEAYGRAKVAEEDRLQASGPRDKRALERAGREAGRRAQVQTVSAFLKPADRPPGGDLTGRVPAHRRGARRRGRVPEERHEGPICPVRTSRPVRSTSTRARRCRSFGSGTACRTGTSTARGASRRSSPPWRSG